MNREEYSGYIGWFKQPLERPQNTKPTMYVVADHNKQEMDLVLLTPGCFLDAYRHIKTFGSVKTRVFIPSLRMEWISDIFNLYMSARNITDIKWVFPNRSEHSSFEEGHILEVFHQNEFDSHCGVGYIHNESVPQVYDIEVYDSDGKHYFSQYATEENVLDLAEDEMLADIHLPYRSTIYGGDSYLKLFEKDPAICRSKLVPHSFLSVADYYIFQNTPNVNRGKVITYDFI